MCAVSLLWTPAFKKRLKSSGDQRGGDGGGSNIATDRGGCVSALCASEEERGGGDLIGEGHMKTLN